MTQHHRLEREVRAILRRARRPEDLEDIPLVRDLCNALGISNASLMLRELVDAAFSETPAEIKLRELILDCDLNGTTTQEGAARTLNVSRRQFHRLRTQAVRLIAKQAARTLVDMSEDAPKDDIEQLARSLAASRPDTASKIFSLASSATLTTRLQMLRARLEAGEYLDERAAASFPLAMRPAALALVAQSRFLNGEGSAAIEPVLNDITKLASLSGRGHDDFTRFELEYLNFLRAKARNDAITMRSSARKLERFSGERKGLQRRAISASADAAIRCGDVDEARRLIARLQGNSSTANDVQHLANASLLSAQIHFFEGSYYKAEIAARAARLALAQHFPDALRAEILIGRIALAAETAWDPNYLPEPGHGEALERSGIANVYARYLLRHRDVARAQTYARDAYERAKRDGFHCLSVYALVTLGAIEDIAGSPVQAQVYYENALVDFAEVFDTLASCDLFTISGLPERQFGPIANVDVVIEPLLVSMRRLIPDLLFASSTMQNWHEFLRALLRDENPLELARSAENSVIHRVIARHATAIEQALMFFATPIVPLGRRPAFVTRTRNIIRSIAGESSSNVPTIARGPGDSDKWLEA